MGAEGPVMEEGGDCLLSLVAVVIVGKMIVWCWVTDGGLIVGSC